MKYLIIIAITLLSACASITEHSTGLSADGKLKPCPKAPRCAASQGAVDERLVAPLQLRDGSAETWQALIDLLSTWPRTEVVERSDTYAHAEIVSPWHFYTDDVELQRAQDSEQVSIRSTGRIGHYDFNVNRDRLEALRAAAQQSGLLASTPAP